MDQWFVLTYLSVDFVLWWMSLFPLCKPFPCAEADVLTVDLFHGNVGLWEPLELQKVDDCDEEQEAWCLIHLFPWSAERWVVVLRELHPDAQQVE